MDHFGILLSLIGAMFLSIIGVYVWTFKVWKDTGKSLAEIYMKMNEHIQKPDIHTDKKELVNAEVCKVVHEHIAEDLQEIKGDVKCLLEKW